MKVKSRWIAWLMVMTMCLFGFTACGDSGSTEEEEGAAVVTDPVKITCENGVMLVSGEFVDKPEFAAYKKIEIPEDEAYAANCIWMNGTVIVPEGYPAVKAAVEGAGYPVITVDTSEFKKIDGGLSCLSLRF